MGWPDPGKTVSDLLPPRWESPPPAFAAFPTPEGAAALGFHPPCCQRVGDAGERGYSTKLFLLDFILKWP